MATYAISDLHSCMKLWEKVKNYIKEEDVLYVLGDNCDRGPDGIDVLMDLLKRPNTYMIRGNHEEFLINGIKRYLGLELGEDSIYPWILNGGSETYDAIVSRGLDFMLGLVNQIEEMPTRIDYTNVKGQKIILTHAGFNPFSVVYETSKEKDTIYMWDRNLTDAWNDEYKGKDYSNIYLVHGHTPTIAYGKFGIDRYAKGHKINIDMGAFYSHQTCLFNLDTLEVEEYFVEDGYETTKFKKE